MFLKFIGSGSALNTSLGNNSAYIKEGKSLLLIDCGSTTFSRMQHLDLFEGVENLFVAITHRHPDHISSLGDLIFYTHYILKTQITILTPDDANLIQLLSYMGVSKELYHIVKLEKKYNIHNADLNLTLDFIPVPHVEDMDCYGFIMDYKSMRIYYSGDSKDMPFEIQQQFQQEMIQYIYQDVCSYKYENNPHMNIDRLCELIDKNERHRVFCMHFDEGFEKEETRNMGFRTVENIMK